MSERLKSSNQVSNEDIIHDLTKDLNISLNTADNAGEFVINPSTSAEGSPKNAGDATHTKDIPHPTSFVDKDLKTDLGKRPDPTEAAASQENTENTTKDEYDDDKTDTFKDPDGSDKDSDTDSIDEESLKDTEVDLTDDQKEERKIIAEELKEKGNHGFKIGDYVTSVEKYTLALQTCPLQFAQLRAVLYCNRSAARMKLEKYDKAIKDCSKAVELDDKYLKAYIRRAQSYEQKKKLDESLADYKKVLELDPTYKEAQKAVIRLPPLIEEKNEKLKTEMFGKLKDLGNMILKPFGLSTSNFQMEQDPESKGYKINFKQ